MPVNLLDLGALGDVLGFFATAFAGWRYLFSPSYRRHVHARWQSRNQLQIAQDVAAAVVGSLLVLAVSWLLLGLFFGFDWMARIFQGTSPV